MNDKKLRAGDRCPRCHRKAPRQDGIVCKLCCPNGPHKLTITDAKTGVTHWYRSKCRPEVLLGGLSYKEMNIGDVPVTCIDCIAVEDERGVWFDTETTLPEYAKADTENTIHMAKALGLC